MSETDYTSESDDASDTEVVMERNEDGNYRGINRRANILDWIYQYALDKIDEEIRQIREGTHPVYVAIVAEHRKQYDEYLIAIRAYYDNKKEKLKQKYIREKEEILKDSEAAKVKIKEEIRTEIMEKIKTLQSEYALQKKSATIETNTTTKKLQKSPNEAA